MGSNEARVFLHDIAELSLLRNFSEFRSVIKSPSLLNKRLFSLKSHDWSCKESNDVTSQTGRGLVELRFDECWLEVFQKKWVCNSNITEALRFNECWLEVLQKKWVCNSNITYRQLLYPEQSS